LMECAHLIGFESSNNGMKDAPIMEQNHIALFPIVRVHELWGWTRSVVSQRVMSEGARSTYWRCNSRPLHLIHQISDFLQICQCGPVGIECFFCLLRASRERGNLKREHPTWMDLIVKSPSDGVLPNHRE